MSRAALCLSGGGFRAALFHLGTLTRLNEAGLLSTVQTVSSVSGGSILAGLLAVRWPRLVQKGGRFTNFEAEVVKPFRQFASRNRRPLPRGLLLSALGRELDEFLYENAVCEALSPKGGPRFCINATNLATGVNFRFSAEEVGDWKIGFRPAPALKLSKAVTASCAIPPWLPPVQLKIPEELPWEGRPGKAPKVVRLQDGGVYDNLALEPVWKPTREEPPEHDRHQRLFVSDGGSPTPVVNDPGSSRFKQWLRCVDIQGDQAQAVRKRRLVDNFVRKDPEGVYLGLAKDVPEEEASVRLGFTGGPLERVRAIRTDLNRFTRPEQEILITHGWCVTDHQLARHLGVPQSDAVPYGKWLDDAPKTLASLRRSHKHELVEESIDEILGLFGGFFGSWLKKNEPAG